MGATSTKASFFRQLTECMRCGHFFTELPDQPAGTYLSAKGSLYHILHCKRNQQNRTRLKSPFRTFGTVRFFSIRF